MKYGVILLLVVTLLGFIVPLSFPGKALADNPTKYENYVASEDAGAVFYQQNWVGQTFTSDADEAHTVSRVRAKLYRTGSPGIVNAYLYETSGSLPTGVPIGEGSISGDYVTNYTDGGWYFFDLDEQVNLEIDTEYAIVLEAATANASNAIYWRYDNGGGYAAGQCVTSEDAGGTWGNSGNDMMFEVWGYLGTEVVSAKVFSSYIETGDQLFVFSYKVIADEAYTAQVSTDYFTVKLMVDDTLKAQMRLPSWGYKPGSFYLDSDVALEWNVDDAYIEIEGVTGTIFDGASTNYTLVANDWVGGDLESLDDWVLSTAGALEDYYDVALTTTIEGTYILNDAGKTIFKIGVPALDDVRPGLFAMATVPGLPGDDVHDPTALESTLEDNFGAGKVALSNFGDITGFGGTFMSGAYWLIVMLLAGLVVGTAVNNLYAGMLCSSILLVGGVYLGLIPVVYLALPLFLGLVYKVAQLTWWRA